MRYIIPTSGVERRDESRTPVWAGVGNMIWEGGSPGAFLRRDDQGFLRLGGSGGDGKGPFAGKRQEKLRRRREAAIPRVGWNFQWNAGDLIGA